MSRPERRLSGGAVRRPLQPQVAIPEAAGLTGTKTPPPPHWYRDEQHVVH